ncbi:MAG: DMT family transporter [Chloroflexota bacterium]|nr:DMT family transporter [Chloroflexota bacterium]
MPPHLSPHALAVLALAAATALWGTSFVAAKALLVDLPPVTVAFLRFALAVAILVPVVWATGHRPLRGMHSALLGLSGVTLFFLFQNAGLRHASAADATLILGGGLPALTALFGAGFLAERPSRRQLAGLACSLGGVAAVALAGGVGEAGASLRGDGLLALAAASGAVYTVLGRKLFGGPELLAALAGSTGYRLLFLAPGVAVELATVGATWPGARGLLLLLYLGGACSALAFALWAYGLRHLTVTQVAVVSNVELPIGVAAAALLLGEGLGRGQLVGGVLVLLGAWLAVAATGVKEAEEVAGPDTVPSSALAA